jgi:hypothetical protein
MLQVIEAQKLSGQEILDEYNRHTNKFRKAKFQSKEEGIQALIKIGAVAKEEPKVEVKAVSKSDIRSDVGNAIEMLRSIQANIEKNRKAPADPDRPQGRTDAHRAHWEKKIKLLVHTNPRRGTSQAAWYFEIMRQSKTVGEYLDKFSSKEDKKKASQWLSNTINDGYIELV